jgi:DNA-binding IclR family transcriptional regulator
MRRHRKSVIQGEMQRHASHGFCLSHSEPGATLAVGVPVRLHAGNTLSLNCVVATHLATEKRMTQEIGPRLTRLARDLELSMGRKT